MSRDRVALASRQNNPPSPFGTRRFAYTQPPRLIAQVLLGVFALGVAQAQETLTRTERPEVKPGDQWKYELRDKRTGAKVRDTVVAVTAVSATQIESIENGVAKVATRDLVVLKNSRLEYDVGYRWLSFPLEVGKAWDFKTQWKRLDGTGAGSTQMDVVVKGVEKVTTKAGEFNATRLEAKGYMNAGSGSYYNGRVVATYWYAPAAREIVKFEWQDKLDSTVTELIEVQLAP